MVLDVADPFPLIAVLLARHEASVDLEHEHGVRVPELPGDEFRGRSTASRTHRVAVPLVAQLIVLDLRELARRAMRFRCLPAVDAGEE